MMINGYIVINKEVGMSSRKVDNFLSKLFKTKKCGHLGTLDPLASGVLPVFFGEGTKAIPFLENSQKEYVTTFKLGLLTSTLDLEGEIKEEVEVSPFSQEEVINALISFTGTIKQTPPLASALKVDGKPLYEYMREGKEVKIKEREVEVYELELLSYNHPYFSVRALVSKGTYIRTLGNDIANRLGTFATTTKLERTLSAPFKLSEAVKLDEVTSSDIRDVNSALSHIPSLTIFDKDMFLLTNGQPLKLESIEPLVRVLNKEGRLLALYEKSGEIYQSVRGFNL